jgi:hypothetical protein
MVFCRQAALDRQIAPGRIITRHGFCPENLDGAVLRPQLNRFELRVVFHGGNHRPGRLRAFIHQ